MNVDFHIHTNISDGGKKISDILNICKTSNVNYISITDHNSFKELQKLINKNKCHDLKIINGIEIDVRYTSKITFHMLLYNFDVNSPLLEKYYINNRKNEIRQFKKNINILEKSFNIKLDKNIVKKFIKRNNYFDRIRLNNLLVECQICNTPREAFDKYTNIISKHKRKKITMKQLFYIEKQSKGIVSLAHPLYYGIDINEMKSIILQLKRKYNLKVVEAINNRQTIDEEKNLMDFCMNNNLYISCGSDAHYKIGDSNVSRVGIINGRKINESQVNFLKLIEERPRNE